MKHSWKLRGTSLHIVRGRLDPAVMLIFSSSCHRPACCFSSICFNKSGITASPTLSSAPGWCGVECLLLSATPSTHSAPKPNLSEKGYYLLQTHTWPMRPISKEQNNIRNKITVSCVLKFLWSMFHLNIWKQSNEIKIILIHQFSNLSQRERLRTPCHNR